jgi:isochorismate hydrolase
MTKAYLTPANLDEKVEEWTASLEAFDRPDIRPDPGGTALLIIDMQRYFLDSECSAYLPASKAIIPRINKLIDRFKHLGLPVVFTKHLHKESRLQNQLMAKWWGELIMEGTRESELDPCLKRHDAAVILTKDRYSAFCGTGLETLLRSIGVASVIITGVMTNLCCESTARDAFFRDFKVFFVPDATATLNEEMHFASLLNLEYGFSRIMPSSKILRLFEE